MREKIIHNFTLKCKKCKSKNVVFREITFGACPEHREYSEMDIVCKDCENTEELGYR